MRRRIAVWLDERGLYRNAVLVAALSGMFATAFPITILTVSLPAVATEFGVRETTAAWVISAPVLLSAIALPLLGRLGDLYGHRRVFLLGFGAASTAALATAFAWSAASLIGLRIVAAVCGAATQPSSMALLLGAYEPRQRVRAMGWWAMVGSAAPAAGLVAGGPLVELLGWRIVFVFQAAASAVALTLAALILRETPRRRARFDVVGALTLALGVGALMFALGRVREVGLDAVQLWIVIAFGSAALVAFVWTERRVAEPLLPLEYLRRRNFSAAMIAGGFLSSAYMGAFVVAPILLIQIFHYSVATASAILLLRTATLAITSPLGGRLGARIGERRTAMLGAALVTVSLLLVARGAAASSLVVLCTGLVLQGLGNGLGVPCVTSAAAGAVRKEDLGLAAAASRLTSQVGVAFGVTTLTMVYGDVQTPDALARAFVVGAGLAAVALVATARMEPPRPSS